MTIRMKRRRTKAGCLDILTIQTIRFARTTRDGRADEEMEDKKSARRASPSAGAFFSQDADATLGTSQKEKFPDL